MIYSEFIKKIRSDDLDSSYLFIGSEEYLMNNAIEHIRNKYVKGSFEEINYIRLLGKDSDLDSLINACETLPFMSEKKLVVLRDVAEFWENMDKDSQKDLYKYLEDLGDFLCLVLVDNRDRIKKNTKLYRDFKKSNRVVDFSKLFGRDLNQWIEIILKKHNKKMSFPDMNYFIEKSSYRSRNVDLSLYDLENELMKLVDSTKKEEINKEDIDKLMTESLDSNIFDLLEAISRFDSGKAIGIFNDMYIANEPVQRIFFMITRQFRLMLGCKLYRERGYNPKQIQDKLQIKSYEFGKISSQSSRWTIEELKNTMDELLDVDVKIKTTSSDDHLLIQILLVKLCNKK